MTVEISLGCSGLPGSTFPPLPCTNLADVRLVRGPDRWKRPMCVDCAVAYEERCAANELPAPLFEEIEPR